MRLLACLTCLITTPAIADVPRVATDILPVHSLVARVMDGVGAPDLILPPGASPHGYSMRPSQAAVLESADMVIWIGKGLTPWLAEPIEVLASDADHLELLEVEGIHLIETGGDRHGDGDAHDDHDDHEGHDHDDHAKEEEHDDHDHAKHDEHKHEDHAGHQDHDDHADHDHGPIDPHAWLDPSNARIWLKTIADTLAEKDPDNANVYRANANAAIEDIDVLQVRLAQAVAPLEGRSFAVYHEAYAYLEEALGLDGGISLLNTDADLPTPRRIAALQEQLEKRGVTVVFSEPGTNTKLIDTVFEGQTVTICELDPIGSAISPGPKHYWQTLSLLAEVMGDCGPS